MLYGGSALGSVEYGSLSQKVVIIARAVWARLIFLTGEI